MTPTRTILVAIASLLALPCLAQDKVNLQPPLKLAKGQTLFTIQQSMSASRVSDSKTREALKDLQQTRDQELTQKIVEMDDKGQPTKIHLTVSGHLNIKGTLPKEEAFKQGFQLRAVSLDLVREGGQWTIQTDTITSPEMKALSGPELYMLRRAVHDAGQAYSRPDLLLMPSEPVAADAKIEPTLGQFAEWTAAANASGRLEGKAVDAKFTLDSIKDGVANVIGTVQLLVPVEKEQARGSFKLGMQIDTASGLVTRRMVDVRIEAKVDQQNVISNVSGMEIILANKPAAEEPKTTNALGWKPVKDTSTWHDAEQGLGLTLPEEYTQRKGQPAWTTPGGGSLSIEIRHRDFMPTIQELLKAGVANLQRPELKLADIAPQEPFRLADGMPAIIVKATADEGKTAMLVLLVADGPRTIAITAAAPKQATDRLAEMETVLRSLRMVDAPPTPTSQPAMQKDHGGN